MKYTKKEIQKRVSRNGKRINLKDFNWDSETKVFSSTLDSLVLDFEDINNCTFKTSHNCTFKTSHNCTFNTYSGCTFKTSHNCTFKTSHNCTFNTYSDCTFKTGSHCTFNTYSGCTFNTSLSCSFNTGHNCTFKTDLGCTFNTHSNCTFKTSHNCTFNTGSHCSFNTSYGCSFKAGYKCNFKTSHNCTFNTRYNCTFNTAHNCTFKTTSDCVVVRRDIFEVIILDDRLNYKLKPYNIAGFLISKKYEDIWYNEDHEECVIIDNILSKVIQRKGNVLKVINYNEDVESYIVSNRIDHAHGSSIKEAKESLIYKISDKNTEEYSNLKLDSIVSYEDAVKMYRKITGSCETQTKAFAKKHKKKDYTIKELVELTENRFGSDLFKNFFLNTL